MSCNACFDYSSFVSLQYHNTGLNRSHSAGVFRKCFTFPKLHGNNGGFLMNREVKFVAELVVLEVIEKPDVSKEAEDATQL